MSIEDLLKLKVSVASAGEALTQRESPGIVTLITREEIQHSGARDLMDILRLVPGIEFVQDVQGAVSLSVRGIATNEGKVLFLLDGIEITEVAYGLNQVGNRFNPDQIERIEIIRGPGSARYGGFAEMGVVNIVTRQVAQGKMLRVNGQYGQGKGGYLRRTIGASVVLPLRKSATDGLVLHAYLGQGNRSNAVYQAIDSASYNLSHGKSATNPASFNGRFTYKGLQITGMTERYKATYGHGLGLVFEGFNLPAYYDADHLNIQYTWKVSPKITLVPRINYRGYSSFNSTTIIDTTQYSQYKVYANDFFGGGIAKRFTGGVSANINFNAKVSLQAGAEQWIDRGIMDPLTAASQTFWTGHDTMTLFNTGLFAQMIIQHPLANVTIGGRMDYHSTYGFIAAPRVAITRVFNRFHLKMLASTAYRTPTVYNINAAPMVNQTPDIAPEQSATYEFEGGYRFNRFLSLQGNFFYGIIQKTIIYFSLDSTQAAYGNRGKTGSAGGELELRYKQGAGYANLTYSYYTTGGPGSGINEIDIYRVPQHTNSLLGTPQHKVTASGSIRLPRKLRFSPSVVWVGAKYAYTHLDNEGIGVITKVSSSAMINISLEYRTKFYTFSVAGYNLLNASYQIAQAYDGYDTPFPTNQREFVLRAAVDLGALTNR